MRVEAAPLSRMQTVKFGGGGAYARGFMPSRQIALSIGTIL